jgi:Tol biopolymer transport system component
MRAVVALLAVSGMITIDQRDGSRTDIEAPSAAVSADGRLIAFATYGRLAQGDTDDRSDVYVLDRASGQVMLESVDEDQAAVQSDARFPVMSGDGRTLVYERNGQLIVRDRAGGTVGSLGAGRQPAISRDGSLVAFTSARTDAAPVPDANGAGEDVYLLDRSRGAVARLSVDSAGTQHATGESFSPSMSSDGRFVAFVSTAALDRAASVDRLQVFVRDTRSGTTKRIAEGWDPSISGDGRFVAYVAYGAHRAVNRRSPRLIYVADGETGQTQLISGDAENRPANGSSANPVISSDGRFVAFQSDASNLLRPGRAEDFNLLSDVFLFDRSAGVMLRVSTDEANCWIEPSGGPAIDPSASVIVFTSKHPTGPGDGSDDYDLYVASLSR